MKPEFEQVPLAKNELRSRFEIDINSHFAFINYGETVLQIALVHTEVEPPIRGIGAAQAVVEKTLHYVEDSGKELLPFCLYVRAYIQKHPEWKRLVDKQFSGYSLL